MIGQFFDTMFVASMIKCGYNDTSKSKSWNVLETVLSPLNYKSIYSRILASVCAVAMASAVAMATGLVKHKA